MATILRILTIARLFNLAIANTVKLPTITPRARLPWERRQDSVAISTPSTPEDFVAWYTGENPLTDYSEAVASTCISGSLLTTTFDVQTYIGCAETDMDVGLVCDGTLVYGFNTSVPFTCATGLNCLTHTVYTGTTADTDGRLWVECFEGDKNVNLFQQLPLLEITTTVSSTESSFTTTFGSSSIIPTATSTTNSNVSTPEASKAWVAGVVVGGLALFAIVGLGLWFFLVRRRNKPQSYQQAPQSTQYAPPSYTAPDYQTGYSHAYPESNTAPLEQKGVFSPQNLQGGQDPRYSFYAHNGVPGAPAPGHSPPPEELPAAASPVTAELPGVSEPSSKTPR